MHFYNQILSDYLLHQKSRTQKHALYPVRFWVPDDKVSWLCKFPDYLPAEYNAPIVLDVNTPWADPHDISKVTHSFTSFVGEVMLNDDGIPMNPIGRTGICGRGVLGKWGANFAVDAIITTIDAQYSFRVLTITRKDTGESAFPGGMVDPGEDIFETRNRELAEELSLKEADLSHALYEKTVSQGYVDDPRNTDNAWMETTAIHTHLSFDVADKMILIAGDDAVAYSWTKISKETVRGFYANHALTLLKALTLIVQNKNLIFSDDTLEIIESIIRIKAKLSHI